MAVPDYFQRNAVAAAQAISGLDEQRLASILGDVRVGVTIGRDAQGHEGRATTDLLIRLLARLYPVVQVRADGDKRVAEAAEELAARINPKIEFSGKPSIEIVIGSTRLRRWSTQRIFAGSNDWNAAVSTTGAHPCGDSVVPFGAGVAACLAAANLFRHVFLPEPRLDRDARFEILGAQGSNQLKVRGAVGEFVLAGAGAIGNAAAWALARTPVEGTVSIVDHQKIDLGNLQRYVLAERDDENKSKVSVVAGHFGASMHASIHECEIARFLEMQGHGVERLLLALDSAVDRRAGQASLPRWIANAWTQPGDLGVSTHDFLGGACVCCLYLPERALANEDATIAEAFGVPARLMQIRLLLHRGEGATRDLLEAIAVARDVPIERLLPFEGRSVRELYVQGFCGGAVIPLERIGAPRQEVHVPLAHQSALAGVLLGAEAVRYALRESSGSQITQVDVLRPVAPERTRAAAKDTRGICICQDTDYVEVYKKKFVGSAEVSRSAAHPRGGRKR